jgi:hypothetical protein
VPCNRQSIASALLLVRPGESSDAGVLDGAGGSAGASHRARALALVVLVVLHTMITMVGVLWTPPGGSKRLDRTRYTEWLPPAAAAVAAAAAAHR